MDIRSDVVEEVTRKMNGSGVWPDNKYHQRRDADRRVEEQERQPGAEVVARAAEEDLGDELDGLAGDGDVVEQGDGVGPGAVRLPEGLEPEVEVVGRHRVARERPGDAEGPQLPEGEAAEEVLGRDADLGLAADPAGARQGDLYVAGFEVEFCEWVRALGLQGTMVLVKMCEEES